MPLNRIRAFTSPQEAEKSRVIGDIHGDAMKCAIDEEKREVAAIKVRRNFYALQRLIPELAYLSPERLAEIAGHLATAPL